MQTQGQFSIDMQWKQSELAKAVITSNQGNVCTLRTAAPLNVVCNGRALAVTTSEDGSISFPTRLGESYVITPR